MYLINDSGRIVDLPARMEEDGYHQAREVLSISTELMNGYPMAAAMNQQEAQILRDKILARFPGVVTDEEYMAGHPEVIPQPIIEEPVVESKTDEVVEESKYTIEMTKQQIIDTAIANGVELNNQEQRLNKTKLIELINDRN